MISYINPEVKTACLYKSDYYTVTEKIREIMCDKYGLEGDAELTKMIDEIYWMLNDLKVW